MLTTNLCELPELLELLELYELLRCFIIPPSTYSLILDTNCSYQKMKLESDDSYSDSVMQFKVCKYASLTFLTREASFFAPLSYSSYE